MNAAPWSAGPAAPAPPPEDVAAVRLDAPAFAPVGGVLEAILRSTAPRRITLLAAGGGRLSLLAAEGALLAVEGAEGPPAESGKARAARLAAVLGGFCAAAAAGGTIRARMEAAPDGAGGRVRLPVPPETLAAFVPVLPGADETGGSDGAGEARPGPAASEGPGAREADCYAGHAPAAAPPAEAPKGGPAPDPVSDARPDAPPDMGPDTGADTGADTAPDTGAGTPDDGLGEALARALGEAGALAGALPGAGIAWAATRAEAAAGGGRLAARAEGRDAPGITSGITGAGAGGAAAALDRWIAGVLGEGPGEGAS